MNTRPMQTRLATLAGTALALALSATAAQAQTTPHSHPTAAAPPKATSAAPATQSNGPGTANLQQEIDALREEVRQLKKAQQGSAAHGAAAGNAKTPAAKKRGMQMEMEPCNGMKPDSMGMKDNKGMPMDKMDDCMAMPPADSAKPDGMTDDMDEMGDM